MDILKREIEKKRKLLLDENIINENKKYFKGSEILGKKNAPAVGVTIKNPNENSVNSTNEGAGGSQTGEEGADHQVLGRKEVIRRLRDRGEPILLFGETEVEAFRRLRKSEILEPEINKGFRNDFQEALQRVDQAYLDEIIASSNDDESCRNENKPAEKDPNVIYEEIQKNAGNLGKGDAHSDMDIIVQFLQLLLKLWNNHLTSLSSDKKTSTNGKLAFATYSQTQLYLRPLFRKLKSKTLPEDILDSLTIIIKHLLDRNYIMASDAYLQMAIGNAPWPIGVTMVGIHARTGREKIYSKNVAHVLNDETQRKYIQGLKRLMTKCQQFFPTDPSRCVEYVNDT